MSYPSNFKTVVLYSIEDLEHKEQLDGHLKFHARTKDLGTIQFECVEYFGSSRIAASRTLEDAVVIICLTSYPFFNSYFGLSDYLSTLVEHDRRKMVTLICIHVDQCDLQKTRFKKMIPINEKETPIGLLDNQHYHHALHQITEKVADLIPNTLAYHRKLEIIWKKVKKVDKKSVYDSFLLEYPNSRFGEEIKKRVKELEDQKLWKDALAINSTFYYLGYLQKAPLKRHKTEAIEKIIEIESSESVAIQDVLNNDNLGIFFDYKLRFRNEENLNLVNGRIFEMFSRSVDQCVPRNDEIDTAAHLLHYKIYETCTKQEVLTFELLEKFNGGLCDELNKLIERTNLFRLYFYIILIIIVMFGIIPFLTIIFEWMRNAPLIFFLGSMFLIFYTLRAYFLMLSDIQHYANKIKVLHKKFVELQISFITVDHIGRAKLLLFFYNTEEWIADQKRKTFWHYFRKTKKADNPDERKIEEITKKLNRLKA